MSTTLTPAAFRSWLWNGQAGEEIGYSTEEARDEDLMAAAREALDAGRVTLFRRRLNGTLWMVARIVSGKAKRFLAAAPDLGAKPRTFADPDGYVPFSNPSGRGLRKPTIPDGYDGPSARREVPTIGGDDEDTDD